MAVSSPGVPTACSRSRLLIMRPSTRRSAISAPGWGSGRSRCAGGAASARSTQVPGLVRRRLSGILKAASAFSPRNSAVPRRDDPVRERVTDRFGVEGHLPPCGCDGVWVPHCLRLPGREERARRRPGRCSTNWSGAEIARLHAENYGVNGVRIRSGHRSNG